MRSKISLYNYAIRVAVIILAIVSPFICILTYGYKPSISSYWDTDLQPLFIIANASTSYYLYSIRNWKASALSLLMLTSFSVELYPSMHNAMAIFFFVSNIRPLLITSNFKWCIYPYMASILILPFSMTYSEIMAIISLCLYHLLILAKLRRITNGSRSIS